MNRPRRNYWVDLWMGTAGLASAASGLVFLLPGDANTRVLGLSYQAWSTLHTWSSLAAIVAVAAHTALHWRWMVAMTRQVFSARRLRTTSQGVRQAGSSDGSGIGLSRRAFLLVGAAATVVAAAMVTGYRAISASAEEAGSSGSPLAETKQDSDVACPRGLTYDPYPGRCRLYVDSDGDGYCDYSVPGSGNTLASDGLAGAFPAGSHRGHGFGQR